jgi:dihydroxyacid dehydratase/phosphogluconate dehydratase
MGMDATPVTFHLTADERVYLELCLVRRRELLALSDVAAEGKVLTQCESATLEISRQQAHLLLRDAIARRVANVEKKAHQPGCVPAAGCDKAVGPMNAPS